MKGATEKRIKLEKNKKDEKKNEKVEVNMSS